MILGFFFKVAHLVLWCFASDVRFNDALTSIDFPVLASSECVVLLYVVVIAIFLEFVVINVQCSVVLLCVSC